jgi:hypothetical protein
MARVLLAISLISARVCLLRDRPTKCPAPLLQILQPHPSLSSAAKVAIGNVAENVPLVAVAI